ncbi:glyoxylase I 4-like [Lycium barbarum]|uniref:glyoxylase I 4-like n=1 Tax=Lycium barbarum TaxID=112863 RepID=UPI00293F0FBE|nr:glyoxylase I 4-like [Lycium barbarum]
MGKEIVRAESGDESTFNWSSDSSSIPSSAFDQEENRMPLLALNHVSYACKSVPKSVQFYVEVLGFGLIQRPSSFEFEGAWLFNHGIGIHLIGEKNAPSKQGKINPKDNHISFQCSDMNLIIQRLHEMKIEYVTAIVKDGGITVDQLFFHDPDGNMIEICNCQNIPILPISSCPLKKLSNLPTFNQATIPNSFYGKGTSKKNCVGEMEYVMMESLAMNMMDIAF